MCVLVNHHNIYKLKVPYKTMKIGQLTDIGFTKNQAETYLEVLKTPGQTGGEISKKLSIDRSFAYGILDSLVKKGLVNYIIKRGARIYSPSNPKNLLKEIEEKREKAIEIIKEIKEIKRKKKDKRSVSVYEGKEGLKVYVRDLLGSKEFSTLGGGGKLNILDILKYEHPHYSKEINRKKISGKLITSSENKKTMRKVYGESEVKIKSLGNLKSSVSLTIFKDKIAIYSAEDKPFVIMIEDKKFSEFFKIYFDNLWKSLK